MGCEPRGTLGRAVHLAVTSAFIWLCEPARVPIASTPHEQQKRSLTLGDAVAIGGAAVLGAGVFTVFGPAAQSAGRFLLLALVIAALVAIANALSTAQLAAALPVAGGAYTFGREYLGPWPGYLAGLMFIVGKLASCAAISLAVGAYTWPGQARWVALAAVLALFAVNAAGVARTARAARVSVGVVLTVLGLAIVVAIAAPPLLAVNPGGLGSAPSQGSADGAGVTGFAGIAQAAGLLFFAFAGYARIATLGEEVKEPRVTIPKAIILTLCGVLTLYSALAGVLVWRLGLHRLATSATPVRDVVESVPMAGPVVVIGAAIACLGSLLALLAGISRTALAMARVGDLPHRLSSLSPRGVPLVAEAVSAGVVVVLIWVIDLRSAIALSSVCVLLYYLVANLSALRQGSSERRIPRAIPLFGALGCLGLAFSLPRDAVLAAAIVLVLGVGARAVARPRLQG